MEVYPVLVLLVDRGRCRGVKNAPALLLGSMPTYKAPREATKEFKAEKKTKREGEMQISRPQIWQNSHCLGLKWVRLVRVRSGGARK